MEAGSGERRKKWPVLSSPVSVPRLAQGPRNFACSGFCSFSVGRFRFDLLGAALALPWGHVTRLETLKPCVYRTTLSSQFDLLNKHSGWQWAKKSTSFSGKLRECQLEGCGRPFYRSFGHWVCNTFPDQHPLPALAALQELARCSTRMGRCLRRTSGASGPPTSSKQLHADCLACDRIYQCQGREFTAQATSNGTRRRCKGNGCASHIPFSGRGRPCNSLSCPR